MAATLRKLHMRASATADASLISHIPLPVSSAPRTAVLYSGADLSTRIHKLEAELADLPEGSPLRANFQAILRDYKEKGEAYMMYQNGRALDVVNVDLKRGPLYVERCSISIMSDESDDEDA
ncbi:hypothetical protein H072_5584 [Dactylellina haptotyla CBS 200.50]|uniref:Uncharacterized protein n=1 Tax=Dactylellina haptotyla (strain CBS 200.50) TaxID=1284197 RepID=S8BYW2_DACHA|nr:hypothetical protein H072_5584 [Dactylellina haptotyla CBS 200.50]